VRIRSLVLVAVVAAVAIAVGCGHIGDRVILWPNSRPEDAHGATRTLVPLGGGALEIFRARSCEREPELFVLRFYGNTDRAERWVANEARGWAAFPIEFWSVNYPGYGGSTGPARLRGVADAAVAAYDALAAVAGSRPIYVFGTSIGSTAALHVAAERKVAGLMLQNPPALRELIMGEHGWWNLWLLAYPISRQVPRALDSIANARRVTTRAVFLLADEDEVVPHKYHRLVADAFAGPKEILIQTGAHHSTPFDLDFTKRSYWAIAKMLGGLPE
jgi:pimeloyl-ACP methyl ester carboxylesterase